MSQWVLTYMHPISKKHDLIFFLWTCYILAVTDYTTKPATIFDPRMLIDNISFS